MLRIDQDLYARRVIDYLRSPDGDAVFREFESSLLVAVVLTLMALVVGIAQLPTVVWPLSGLKLIGWALTLQPFADCRTKARNNPGLLPPLILHGIIASDRDGLVLGPFS